MPKKWSHEEAIAFWSKRKTTLVCIIDDLSEKVQSYNHLVNSQSERYKTELEHFTNGRHFEIPNRGNLPISPQAATCQQLQFWIEHCSWTFCKYCGSLTRRRLLPNFKNLGAIKAVNQCPCSTMEKYIFPKVENMPMELLYLTREQILALRPFKVHTGEYERHPQGYRVKSGMFRVSPDPLTVLEKLGSYVTLPDVKQLITFW